MCIASTMSDAGRHAVPIAERSLSMVSIPGPDAAFEIDPSVYCSPHAVILGSVAIGAESSVWPMAVIRGDNHRIIIGARSNIQDGAILHADPDAPLMSIGHAAIIHGCTIESRVLIGMGAVVLNHARIGAGSLIAARALVPEGMVVPPGSLVIGMPGTVRPLREEHRARIMRAAQSYVALQARYRASAQGSASL
jgi:carbonic anhydrase/acetyltransferase-like protein (isoleucine patch superfamily)